MMLVVAIVTTTLLPMMTTTMIVKIALTCNYNYVQCTYIFQYSVLSGKNCQHSFALPQTKNLKYTPCKYQTKI